MRFALGVVIGSRLYGHRLAIFCSQGAGCQSPGQATRSAVGREKEGGVMNAELAGKAGNFEIMVDNINIVGAVFYPPEITKSCPVLCFCHGIPGTKPDPSNSGYMLLARQFAGEGFITCAFNFRGTGASGGNLDLLGWTRDLKAVLGYLATLDGVDPARLYVMGFSGGAAASVYVAAHDARIAALVSCACPSEFSALRLELLLNQCRELGTIRDANFPASFDQWRDHFFEVNPIRWIDMISPRPLLILHGDRDEFIDVAHAHRLYARAGEPKKLIIVPGGTHRLRTSESALAAALDWLKGLAFGSGSVQS